MTTEAQNNLESLIAQISLGNQEAFSSLYDATSGKLFAVCFRILKESANAEDAMQEVYVKIWNKADRYQATGHSPMTWLITIARNTAIDRLRARKPGADASDYIDYIPAAGPTPEQSAIAASEAKRIQGCLNELEPDKREAIVGAYLGGDTYQDLADRFEIPLNTMRTWLRRGLATMRECMAR